MTAGLRLPDYGSGSLAEVLPAVLRGLGVEGPPEAAARLGLPLDVSDQVVLVLVDGLGADALEEHAAEAPFMTALRQRPGSRTITSVFPTTTPIALTSLGTGLTPGEHGITGLLMRLPDRSQVFTLALPSPVDLSMLQPKPTAFERAAAAGVAVTRVGPKRFDGDGLTQSGLRGGRYAPAESVGERVTETIAAVRSTGRSLIYVYYGDLDGTGHRQGCRSAAWRAELRAVDAFVEQLADGLPRGTTLLVTSDHGMVDIAPADRWDVATTPVLDEGVELVGGDLRGVHVYTRPGATDDVVAAWRATIGGSFWVGSKDEAITTGLFGPTVCDDARARIGDVVCAAVGDRNLADSRVQPASVLALIGMHGGLTAAEVEVPLLVG